MTEIAIRAENLSKHYHLGRAQQRNDTLRDALVSMFQRPAPRSPRPQGVGCLSKDSNVPTFQRPEDLWALRDVCFEVQQGEAVGIIGRNGAGKSTLLKILSRITEPTEGRAEIHGRVASLLEVGTGFHPELTGRENIYLNGAILGMHRAEIDRKFDEIVAFAEIERFLDTPVKRYSSGMYVRLAFAVAAHLEPEILLVDEVLAVGDMQFQRKCLGKMGDVTKEGRTVLFVSHNIVAVQTLCQRAFWLDTGQLRAHGAVNEIVTAYLRAGLGEDGANERAWPEVATAPGNTTVRLHRIAVQPEGGSPGDVITMQTPLRVEIEYWNLLPDVHLHTTLHIYSDQGIIAFTTGVDPDPVLHVKPPAGLYRSVCHIPGGLLNSGFHRVSLLLVRGNMAATYKVDEAVGFEVLDNAERKFAWYGKEPGVLSPQLAWSTEYLGEGKAR
jgi:lipopolysaccharide transport system ATP-binding protein